MRTKCLLLSALFLIAPILPRAQVASASSPLVVQGLGEAIVPLDGTWQFRTGDDPAWASPNLDDSAWEDVTIGRNGDVQTRHAYTGFAWYRRHIDFVPAAGAQPDLALFVPPIENAYEMYWNGRRIGGDAKFPPRPVWVFEPQADTLRLGNPQSGVLAIRVWRSSIDFLNRGRRGGLSGAPLVGDAQGIAAYSDSEKYRWLRSKEYELALNLVVGLIAFLGFLAWRSNRDQPALFWMALYTSSWFVTDLLFRFRLPVPFRVSYGLVGLLVSTEDVALWFLLLYLLQLNRQPRISKLTRVLAAITLLCSFFEGSLQLFHWNAGNASLFHALDGLFILPPICLEAFPLVLIGVALKKRLGGAKKTLSAANWLVAISASASSLSFELSTLFAQGTLYTHLTTSGRLYKPLFTMHGNPFPFNILADTFLLVAIVYAVYRYSVEQTEHQRALEQEYRSAQELQRVLIPETLPPLPGFAVTSAYLPAQEVGGDFFQLISKENDDSLFILGDVSGKGLKAAMAVCLLVGTVRTLAEIYDAPAEILSGLNRRMYGRMQNGFVTCLILRLAHDGVCTFANAGHLPPYLNRNELPLPPALPLGIVPLATYDEVTFQLEIGDRLTLYTDGLVEARNASRELFGFKRLEQLIATKPDASQASDAAVSFGQDDDITVLTIARLATGAESSTLYEAPTLVPSPV